MKPRSDQRLHRLWTWVRRRENARWRSMGRSYTEADWRQHNRWFERWCWVREHLEALINARLVSLRGGGR